MLFHGVRGGLASEPTFALGCAVMTAFGATMLWQGYNTPIENRAERRSESTETEKEDMIYINHPTTRQKYQIRKEDNIIRRNFIAKIEREKRNELAANGCYKIDDYLEAQIDEFIDDKSSYTDLGVLTRRELGEAMAQYERTGIQFVYSKKINLDHYEEQVRLMKAEAEYKRQLQQTAIERYKLMREQKLLELQERDKYLMGH